jgi:hypothetical protein
MKEKSTPFEMAFKYWPYKAPTMKDFFIQFWPDILSAMSKKGLDVNYKNQEYYMHAAYIVFKSWWLQHQPWRAWQ